MSAKNILGVDDSATTGNLIRLHLENLGYWVTALANSAEKSLQAIEQELPDLVLMDINLGEGINGIEAATCSGDLRHRLFG